MFCGCSTSGSTGSRRSSTIGDERSSGPGLWDRVARAYDLQLPLERPALRAAAELLAPASSESVLDVGTGTGAFLRELARRGQPPRHAVGVDSSPGMLARAGDLPPGWELVRADATSLPFPPASFHAAACTYVLHLLAEPAAGRVLSELSRVLRPGARLVTVTPAAPRSRLGPCYVTAVDVLASIAPPAFAGLRPLDPAYALTRAGFSPSRGRYVSRGYPSLAILAYRSTETRSPTAAPAS